RLLRTQRGDPLPAPLAHLPAELGLAAGQRERVVRGALERLARLVGLLLSHLLLRLPELGGRLLHRPGGLGGVLGGRLALAGLRTAACLGHLLRRLPGALGRLRDPLGRGLLAELTEALAELLEPLV